MNVILGALKSKTIWASIAVILLGALAQPVQDYIAAHPGIASTLVGALFAVLRGITNGSLADKTSPSA